MTKKFCPTHRFSYNGNICPFCIQDRSTALDRRFNKKREETPKVDENREVNGTDIQRLKEKFGCK